MKFQRRQFLRLLAAGAALPIPSQPARADDWPSRIIKLDVGFPPGGGADAAARIVANGLSPLLDRSAYPPNAEAMNPQKKIERRQKSSISNFLTSAATSKCFSDILGPPASPVVSILNSVTRATFAPVGGSPWWTLLLSRR